MQVFHINIWLLGEVAMIKTEKIYDEE